MNKFHSKVVELGPVTFPEFNAEKVYMQPFLKKQGLPEHLKHWQPTVDLMLQGIETDETIYLMIDQAFVPAGTSHRRPGVHIDGYWIAEEGKHGSHGGHKGKKIQATAGSHGGHKGDSKNWEESNFETPEALILASNVSAARGFSGEFEGVIKNMGNCEDIKLTQLKEVPLKSNVAYIGNVTFLHESLPVTEDCYRTVVRLNVPGYNF